jgi:hypothetical protein
LDNLSIQDVVCQEKNTHFDKDSHFCRKNFQNFVSRPLRFRNQPLSGRVQNIEMPDILTRASFDPDGSRRPLRSTADAWQPSIADARESSCQQKVTSPGKVQDDPQRFGFKSGGPSRYREGTGGQQR